MRHALFAGLVFNERDQPAEVVYLGETPFYVILDDDFRRHVEARAVDSQVMHWLRDRIMEHQDLVTEQAMRMIGRDDLFTKAAVESTIEHMEDAVGQPIPEEARQWLGMLGFKIIIDEQGTVVDIQMPAGGVDEGE